MTTIFTNSIITIKKIGDNEYQFQYNKKDIHLIRSLNIPTLIPEEIHGDDNITVRAQLSSIESLEQIIERKRGVLSYQDTLKLVLYIGAQLVNLDKVGYVYPYLDKKDILVLDDMLYIYVGEELLQKEDSDVGIDAADADGGGDVIQITTPYKKTMYFSPELYELSALPAYIPTNAWVFSLGAIAAHCLTKHDSFTNKNKEFFKLILEPIQYTKLYFCILRCLEHKSLKRRMLFI
jgi:hypothetical protein